MAIVVGLAHHGDDLLDGRWVSRVASSSPCCEADGQRGTRVGSRVSDAAQQNREQRKQSSDPPRIKTADSSRRSTSLRQLQACAPAGRAPVVWGATLRVVRHSVLSTTPTAETPALSDEERLERRRRFIERVLSPDGLDRDTLEHIEQLTDSES